MDNTLREFCLRFRIHYEAEPQLLKSSQRAWLIEDLTGKRWVVKSKSEEDASTELLKSLSVLHGPFQWPQPLSETEDPFILYPYIEGRLLSDGLFETPGVLERMEEVAGRVQAMMRSLILVPFYQEMLRLREPGTNRIIPIADRYSADRLQVTNAENKQARQLEIARSFRWMNGKLPVHCGFVESRGLWPGVRLDAYQDQMQKAFAIHVPIVGSNLAHCAFHPEHLILCPDGEIGVVGWQVEPRPRFYMKYTYWAWSILRSNLPDPLGFYRELLTKEISTTFQKERCQVLSFCILEQLVEAADHQEGGRMNGGNQGVERARELFLECLKNMR